MTAGALGEERPTLFLRNATGLVRGWSVRDSLIYACLATNFVTLGLYEFTFAGPAFPKGQLITATIIGGIWVSFLVIAYTGLVVTIPRAGGDYVWQTRILSSGIGFVMAVTGWWFILWLWAPIYGNILAVQLFEPIWATLKWTWPAGGAAWFGTHNGVFIVTLITIARGRRPGLHRDGRVRQGPAVVLHRRRARLRRHRDPAADQLEGRLHRRVQPGRAAPVRRQQRLRGHQRTRPPRPATPHTRSASARSGRRCCSSRR